MPPRLALVLVSLLTISSLAVREASAQRRTTPAASLTAGVRAGRDFENHAWSLGAQLGYRIQDRFELRPSADYFFGDRTPFRWQANADGAITFGPGRSIYAGGGAAFVKVRPPVDKVKTGYNIFFGLNFAPAQSRSRPFAEFRWTWVNDTSPFRLVLGYSYRLGG
jgi:opacity protein-like surface antigen